ncbi:MAG TPA: FAD-dependent oxidoreductase [Aggregatilinea sp.]|uniref:pyridine nucleotide-disulfide oxidoreductase/dicluster-binding protein n=1 Tax=Aggregatilinea sp. TaxID=2806333 RepID=UPI002D0340A8|nr:pyridine nucleotide-disulfide oxidoreductase/dicluster-binding protein [Aggregatilinea sp.]HML24685.1 FAD-dependent oxidoreductase [Aggregatilinea sp.]
MINLTDQKQRRELESLCIQEHAPACQATCPLHVDARGMLGALGRGDFTAARRLYDKTVPFPRLLSRLCDEPCRAACLRGQAGASLALVALERAALDYGAAGPAPRPLPAREQRIAVVGGGFSGLTAAVDLARKGYAVTLFEAGNRLGGSLWAHPDADALQAEIEADFAVLGTLRIDVRLNAPVEDGAALETLAGTFDAVYLGAGRAPADAWGLDLEADGALSVDPLTAQTSREGVFAGGGLVRPGAGWSPVTSMAEGRRAATSIDRAVQHVSLAASRQNEGSYVTALYTSLDGIAPLDAVPPGDAQGAYTPDEAGRCIQCECMECVKVCEYLAHYGGYPKKYIREIYNNLSIVMGERHSNRFINSCAVCGLCAEVCPTNLNMGAVCSEARRIMVAQNRMPPSAHDFALRDMAFSNSDKFTLVRHQPGTAASAYLFFPGCQLSASHPEYVERIYDWLQDDLAGGVGLALGCCGAPADWAGRADLFGESLDAFRARYEAMGRPALVLACSSCYQVFKTHLPGAELVSLWDVFDRDGLPDGAHPAATGAISIHDPCTTRYEPHMHDSVRRIVTRLGYAVEELPLSREKTTCCGYGGQMWLTNRDLAQATVRRRVAESPADYVTYCAVCRDFFAAQGKRTLHLLDLIFGAEGDPAAHGPGYSQRHENRVRLKRSLLKTVWGEMVSGQDEYERIELRMADEVRARLEDRLILIEDVQQVIAQAERTGSRLVNPATGHILAHYRPGAVTYWVEYALEGEAFVVFNAYSHRMDVGEGGKS